MNNVLCKNADVVPVVICNPLKKSKKGIEPPTNPINASFIHCLRESRFTSSHFPKRRSNAASIAATTRFLEKVKTEESNPATPKLLMNMEHPEMIAVNSTSTRPFLCIVPPPLLSLWDHQPAECRR